MPAGPAGRRPPFFWVSLALGAALLPVYAGAAVFLARYGAVAPVYGWTTRAGTDGVPVVAGVDARGPAAGRLRAGDRVLAVNGDARAMEGPRLYRAFFLDAGRPYRVRRERDGVAEELWLELPLSGPGGGIGRQFLFLLVATVYLATGLFVGLLRPEQRAARLCALSSLLTGPSLLHLGLGLMHIPGWPRALWLLSGAAFPLSLALAYHFYEEFPPGVPAGRGWRLLRHALYGSGALLVLRNDAVNLARVVAPQSLFDLAVRHHSAWEAAVLARLSWVAFACVAIAAVLLRNHRRLVDPVQRRRFSWVLYGSAAAVVPTALDWGLQVAGSAVLETRLYGLVSASAPILLAVSPLALVYAVVKHRVFAVEMLLRRGMQYLLARSVLRASLVMPLVALAALVAADPQRTVAEIFLEYPGYLALAALGAIGLVHGQTLGRWVDRRFFREAYDSEQLLLGLIDEVKTGGSPSEVSRMVICRLERALHPSSVRLFLSDQWRGELQLEYSSDELAPTVRVEAARDLVQAMERGPGGARDFPFRDAAPSAQQAELAALGLRLVVPVRASGGVLGLLLLGEKRSEEPYSTADRRLLETVAAQISIVCENATLRRRVEEEARTRRGLEARLEKSGDLLRECAHCGRCAEPGEERCPREGAALTIALPVTRVVEGKYRLERRIGRGAMGAVYAATDLRLDRRVAVKIMTSSLLGDAHALRRFEREARASARLRHPGIVTVHDFGPLGAEAAYLVMELLEGRTLRAELMRQGTVEPATLAGWMDQMCEAIGAAHAAGVVHRDLKPENVFLTATAEAPDQVKVLDFGLAKLKLPGSGPSQNLTLPGTIMGTLSYMAPEQLQGRAVDERADLFTLGVIAFECLTGRNPFRRDEPAATIAAIVSEPMRWVGEPGDHERLVAILGRCLEKDAARRYATVEELQAELVPELACCAVLPASGLAVAVQDTTPIEMPESCL